MNLMLTECTCKVLKIQLTSPFNAIEHWVGFFLPSHLYFYTGIVFNVIEDQRQSFLLLSEL